MKIDQYVNNFIRLTLLIAIGVSIFFMEWTSLFVSILTLFLTFAPHFFEERYKVKIPIEFHIAIVVFIYATLFLGEVGGFYERFWWWDALLHTGSAIAFGLIGFIILYTLSQTGKIKTNPLWIAIFAFSFAIAMGVIWEIYEFAMDQLFGLNMQTSGLVDTMWDLIVDTLGALIVSIVGYIFLKTGKKSFFGNIIKDFEQKNPKLFR